MLDFGRAVRAFWTFVLGLAILALLGFCGLLLADNLREPAAIRQAVGQAFAEGRFGNADGYQYFGSHRISYFSECIGLSTAILPKDHVPLAGSAVAFTLQSPAVLWQPPKAICQSLEDQLAGTDQPYFAYSRYWHGYRLLTEPFLSLFSYAGLQSVCLGLQYACLLLAGWAIVTSIDWPLGRLPKTLAVVAAFALIVVGTNFNETGLTPTHAVSLTALFACWAAAMRIMRPVRDDPFAAIPACFLAGCVYNFFDFLYNPDLLAFLLGWGWLVGRLAERERPVLPALGEAMLLQVVAIVGYIAMWAAKWLLAFVEARLSGQWASMPAQDFSRWFGGGPDAGYAPLRASAALVAESLTVPYAEWVLAACLLAGIGLVFTALQVRGLSRAATVLALNLVPIILVELKANHTIQHAAFTFRLVPYALVLTVLGLALTLPPTFFSRDFGASKRASKRLAKEPT